MLAVHPLAEEEKRRN